MNRHLASTLISASALGLLLLQPVIAMADPPAHARNENSAKHRGYSGADGRHREGRGQYSHHDDDRPGDRWDDHPDHRDYYDGRRHWDAPNYYPRRGYVVHHLPPRPRVVHYHGNRYYYSGGVWYQPFGPRFVAIDPPMGLVVSFLPEVSATLYFGGVPHYRAGPVFYVWNPSERGYVVTDRPYRGW